MTHAHPCQMCAHHLLRIAQLEKLLEKAEAGVTKRRVTKSLPGQTNLSTGTKGRPMSLSPSPAALKKRRQREKLAKEGG